jgi:hypothetical protein
MDFKEYFRTKSLLKTPNTGVHYEQKITPDLIWCVSHVVLNLIGNDQSRVFLLSKKPSVFVVSKIAKTLNVDIEELIK